jgi:V/A-type H+/Na+-transporting ATPase subunit K
MKRKTLLAILMLISLFAVAVPLAAQEQKEASTAQEQPKKRDITVGLIAAAAAIAVGLTALGTGLAQSRIGAAGAGTIAEKPESAGTIILLLAIPETMVILGFVVAVVMLFTL